jgi:demethylmacrocin O-methyltransferase
MSVTIWLRRTLSPSMYSRCVRLAKGFLSWWWSNDLNRLALLFHTDKWGSHWYTQHYEHYFRPLKNQSLTVLEIGVGGYESSSIGGESLRMWKAYFRKSQIVGIDLYDKTSLREARMDVRQCDQTNSESLRSLSNEYGGFDIVIDDGSHLNDHVIKSFQVLFPLMRANGIYVVEDTQTAYWPTWGGGQDNPGSSMAFFKNLVDGLNHAEYPVAGYTPTYLDTHIVEIAFFHNLVVVRKGFNNEGANCPELIKREFEAG